MAGKIQDDWWERPSHGEASGLHQPRFWIRVFLLHLQQLRYATIISAYAPTLVADEADKTAFYSPLDKTVQRIPATDKIILFGDFNARVGQDHTLWNCAIGRHGIGSCNANGKSLLNLCNSHDLVITNTVFQQSNRYKTSWHHPRSKHWRLLDYVIVRSHDIRDVNITRAMIAADDC